MVFKNFFLSLFYNSLAQASNHDHTRFNPARRKYTLSDDANCGDSSQKLKINSSDYDWSLNGK